MNARPQTAIAYGDFNNDGAIDLMVANVGTDEVSVLLRNLLVLNSGRLLRSPS